MDESQGADRSGTQGPGRPPAQPRLANLVVVAGAIILIGLVAFALYRNSHPGAPAAPPEASATPAQTAGTENPVQGTPIAAQLPVRLTPEASIIAERYRCVCSCKDPRDRPLSQRSPQCSLCRRTSKYDLRGDRTIRIGWRLRRTRTRSFVRSGWPT